MSLPSDFDIFSPPSPSDHSVVHPDPRELVADRERLRDLVLVVREHEVESAAVDLEHRPERVLGHRRALDVPARPAATPRRVPGGVLARLVRLPEREVARILLERVRLLLLHLLPLARQPAVAGIARDAEVDVAPHRVRVTGVDELLDEADDRRDRVRRLRQRVRHPEAEIGRVLEIPLRRTRGELGARARRGVVDLVVDVGDVVDERRLVPARAKPGAQPHPQHERTRVADVRPLVDRRAAEVHPDRAGRLRQLLELPREGAVDAHGV